MKGNTIQKNLNIKKVLQEIRVKGPISKRELQDITDFSWGNISAITNCLVKENLIVPFGKEATAVGRKPEKFDINVSDNFIIGIDFNSEQILVTLCDLKGRVFDECSEVLTVKDAETALETLIRLTADVFANNKSKNIFCISVAVQGDVDSENGISVRNNAIKEWCDIPLVEILSNKFGVETYLFHDPDCLLYSEMLFGDLRGFKSGNSALIRIDHGIGIAVSMNGNIFLGSKGKTCEIGTTIVPFNKSFAKLMNVIGEDAVSKMHFSGLSCEKIAGMAVNGDMEAIGIFSEIGKALGYALNNVCSLLNPEKFVLFGDFTKFCELYLDDALKVLNDNLGDEVPEIIISKQELKSAAVGAALFAADKTIENLEFPD